MDERLQRRRVESSVRTGGHKVHIAFERIHLLDHVVVADPACGKGLRPIRVMRGEETSHADGVQHHQVDVHAGRRAGQIARPRLDHLVHTVLGEFGPQSRPVQRVDGGHEGDLLDDVVDVRGGRARQVMAEQFPVLVFDGVEQFPVRVFALVDGRRRAVPGNVLHETFEIGRDPAAELPFHGVGPIRGPFQSVRHVRSGGDRRGQHVSFVPHVVVRHRGLAVLRIRRGHPVVEFVHLVPVAHAMAFPVFLSCHGVDRAGRMPSNPSRHHARRMYMIMCTRAGAWPNGSTSA